MSGGSKIPKGWVETTLGEVVDKMYSGGTPSTKRDDYYNGDIPWIRTQEVTFNRINEADIHITELGLKNSSAKYIPINTVIVAMYGNSAGRVAISKIEATTNQACCNIISKPFVSKAEYIYYNILCRYEEIKGKANGAAQQNLSVGVLKELDICLPPFEEQQAIAAILTTFDDKIELLQAQNQTLEATAQTIFKEWFGKYQIGDELPEGWREGKLGDIANHSKTSIRPFENPDTEYYHFSLPAYDEGAEPIKEKGIEIKSNKYHVESNSILVSKLNPFTPRIWTVFESQDNFICSTEFQVVKPKKEISFSLIHCLLNSRRFTNKLSQKIKGTSSSHQRVNPKDIFDVELVIPNSEDIIKFDSIVYPLIKKKDVNINQIKTLQQTRNALLPKLMSGKLRVDEFRQLSR